MSSEKGLSKVIKSNRMADEQKIKNLQRIKYELAKKDLKFLSLKKEFVDKNCEIIRRLQELSDIMNQLYYLEKVTALRRNDLGRAGLERRWQINRGGLPFRHR